MTHNDKPRSIDEKFLSTSEGLFSVEFDEGWFFLEVEGRTFSQYPTFNLGTVASGDNTGWQLFENGNGDEILGVQSDEDKVIHTGIGIMPNVEMVLNYQDANIRLGSHPDLGNPSAGDKHGMIRSEDSPYSNPTELSEMVVVPNVSPSVDVYNRTDSEVTVFANIRSMVYHVNVLSPDNEQERQMIKRIAGPGSPMPNFHAGNPMTQVSFTNSVDWDADPLSRSEARGL